MATANLGRVGFVNKGTYSGATAYKVNDVVVYNSGTYACIQANTGQLPTATAYWQVWVANDKALDSEVVHKTGNETIAGVKTFSSSPIVPVPTLINQAISMGNILEKTGAVIGYGTGSGGTVTQLTSKSTAVTLNKPCGQITMNNESLAAGASVTFVLNNSFLSARDCIDVTNQYSTDNYKVEKGWIQAGIVRIRVTNISTSAFAEPVAINFTIIKGATA